MSDLIVDDKVIKNRVNKVSPNLHSRIPIVSEVVNCSFPPVFIDLIK